MCQTLEQRGGPIPCFKLISLLVMSFTNELQALWLTFLQCERKAISHVVHEQGSLKGCLLTFFLGYISLQGFCFYMCSTKHSIIQF
jgi:hypothetical protein